MKFTVLGIGGVGGFVAGALARVGQDVTVVAREATADVLRDRGLRVSSAMLGDFAARPAVVTRASCDGEVLFVACKALGLDAALRRVDGDEPLVVIPLLNGFLHMDRLRARFGGLVAAATIEVESFRTKPGEIVQRSRGALVGMASGDRALGPVLEDISHALTGAGIPSYVGESEAAVIWRKLVRIAPLMSVTAAHDATFGEIRSSAALTAEIDACVGEAASVAAAEGVETDSQKVREGIFAIHDSFRSSMQRDLAAGAQPELDVQRSVLAAAARHGIACPTIERLTAAIAERAAS